MRLIASGTNELRQSEQRRELRASPPLNAAARYFADFLSANDSYGHTADGRRPEERAKQHGYEHCIVLENIAYQYKSSDFSTDELARQFLQGWEHSPGHRKNMLNADVTDIGVAIARNERTGYYFAVQMFGLPWSAATEFSLSNSARTEISYSLGERVLTLAPGETRTHRICGALGFEIRWPDDRHNTVVTPANGDSYSIVREVSGKLLLKKN